LSALEYVGKTTTGNIRVQRGWRVQNNNSIGPYKGGIRGLFWQQPLLALMLTVALLSLAGIPLTVGFIGKFYIFTVGINAQLWWLLGALVIGSGIGIYYYLRVVFAMTEQPSNDSQDNTSAISGIAKIVVCLLIFMMFYLGVLPQPLMEHLGALY